MDRLKAAMMEAENESTAEVKDRVEVVGMTIASCLNYASNFLNSDLSTLDYEILEKGKKTLLSSRPYRVLVSILPTEDRFSDLEEFSVKLGVGDRLLSDELNQFVTPKNRDGRMLVRNYRSGVFLTIFPALGDGRTVDLNQTIMRIQQAGVINYDAKKTERAVSDATGEPVKIGDYVPKPENDSSCKVEISPDEMKANVRITPPRPGGRHLEVQDVVNALKAHGVVIGFDEETIKRALLEDKYMQDILAAQGVPPKHGPDARIDYKVQIKKDELHLEEDSKGRVDYKQMNLVENVVVGQILAEKIAAQKGVLGRTLTNRLVEARDGKDIDLKQGKGTILSEDKTKLIAEINGQVVFAQGKISVEPIYRITGDVGPKTGNIMFLGSVIVGGSVLDNYEVKAAGNVEISGAVQKARIEAEGDIIVKQGVIGREGARLESTGGSLYAKFIQSAEVSVAVDVVVQEGVLHSRVEAGDKIICNGRRAQIVGGNLRATKEVRAKMIGSQAYTTTSVTVGIDPKMLAQHEELTKMAKETDAKLKSGQKTLATLQARKKSDPDGFGEEQQTALQKNEEAAMKLQSRLAEIQEEIVKIDETMSQLGEEGKVHVEKELFPGVTVTIKDASQTISDSYRNVTLTYDKGYVKFGKLEKDEESASRSWRKR